VNKQKGLCDKSIQNFFAKKRKLITLDVRRDDDPN